MQGSLSCFRMDTQDLLCRWSICSDSYLKYLAHGKVSQKKWFLSLFLVVSDYFGKFSYISMMNLLENGSKSSWISVVFIVVKKLYKICKILSGKNLEQSHFLLVVWNVDILPLLKIVRTGCFCFLITLPLYSLKLLFHTILE